MRLLRTQPHEQGNTQILVGRTLYEKPCLNGMLLRIKPIFIVDRVQLQRWTKFRVVAQPSVSTVALPVAQCGIWQWC